MAERRRRPADVSPEEADGAPPLLTFNEAAFRATIRDELEKLLDARGVGTHPKLDFLTMQEAVARSGVSRRTIGQAINRGELAASKRGNGYKIAAAELEAWLRGNPVERDRPAQVKQTGLRNLRP